METIMKTTLAMLLALSVLAGIAVAPASADPSPWTPPHDPSSSPN
jgi:hypothetical protein